MSKKAKKTAAQTVARAAPKAASRGHAKTATKRPASALNDATAERIAIALEAIAGHLSADEMVAGRQAGNGAGGFGLAVAAGHHRTEDF